MLALEGYFCLFQMWSGDGPALLLTIGRIVPSTRKDYHAVSNSGNKINRY